MDFQQLLRQLADEHRRVEQERNELTEEVSRLREKLPGGQADGPLEGAVLLPGQVAAADEIESPRSPRKAAADQAGVVTVRGIAARQLRSEAAETEGHFISMSVGTGVPTTTSTQQGPDAEWSGFTAGLLAQSHQRMLELRILKPMGEGEPPKSVGNAVIEFRSLPPGSWQKRMERLPANGGLVEFEVKWQPGEDGGGEVEECTLAVRTQGQRRSHRSTTASEWLDDKEHLNRARRMGRFLYVFGLEVSQQHTYTVTAESLEEVLAKRGLRNIKESFLNEALRELARVSPYQAPSDGSRNAAFSSILPLHAGRRSWSNASGLAEGISFEAFVDAVLMKDLPKRVAPRLSRGIEKMQEALLKQDVAEVIAKLSREHMSLDVSRDGVATTPKSFWIPRVDTALSVVVTLTVLASIFCLGLSRETDPGWEGWLVLEVVFAVIFVSEIVLKIWMYGSHVFWFGHHRHWNWLDFTVTVISVVDAGLTLLIQNLSDSFQFSRLALICRVFRLMRLGRVLKMIRSPLVRELSNMIVGFVLGSPALFWVSIIIWVVVGLVAMSLRIAVGPDPGEDLLVDKCGHPDHIHGTVGADPACVKHKLYAEEYCGSLSKCMFTVFRCMIGDCTSTGGQSLAAHLSAGFGIKFDVVYLTGMIIMIFGLFNVITAIFVEATMAGLKYNEAKQKLRSVYEHQYVKRKLEELVRRIQYVSRCVQDSDKRRSSDGKGPDSLTHDASSHTWSSGMSEDPNSVDTIELNEDEFFAVIEDSAVKQILMQLDIEIDGAGNEALFELMDSNYSGTVDVASMIETLMKLRGGPMKVDMIAPSVALRGLEKELQRLGSKLAGPAAEDPVGRGTSPRASPKSLPPLTAGP
jgi:hypothetical protein